MRPQQQNRRMRGRNNNNNNRKGQNPLTRNYESNGPDVKIRGSAQQIAEKYTALARDAQSGGDRVMAENYLQHAEHYNRIIAAAQAQMPIHQQMRDNRDELDDELDDDREEIDGGQQEIRAPAQPVDGSGPQPVIEGTPAEVALKQEQAAEPNGDREPRANGNHAINGGEEEAPQRRPRRPRRGRGRADYANGEQANAGSEAADGSKGNGEAAEASAQEASDPAPAGQN